MSKTNYGYDALGCYVYVGDFVASTYEASARKISKYPAKVVGFTEKGNVQLAIIRYEGGPVTRFSKRPDQIVNITHYVNDGRVEVDTNLVEFGDE